MIPTAALPPDAGNGPWALRPATFDTWRKPLAVVMLGAAGAVGAYTVGDRILSDSTPRTTAGAAVPSDHVAFNPAAVPAGGTVTATGYYAMPPHAPVDPLRPRPFRLDRP